MRSVRASQHAVFGWKTFNTIIRFATILLVLVTIGSGCTTFQLPRIDPTGEHVFANTNAPSATNPSIPNSSNHALNPLPTRYKKHPGGLLPWDNVGITVVPLRTIAPVGSEVVLLAGVDGPDGYMRTNERVEWNLLSGSVGQLVDFDRGSLCNLFLADFNWPRKTSSTSIITSTSRKYTLLTRGTPTPNDDVRVMRGQTWATVTSPVEGTSYVTAYAPSVYAWNQRLQTAIIHWIDAQWAFPPPSINPAGTRHTFTTTVTHHSDQSPCIGWIVRYEIVGGPAASFALNGTQVTEAITDSSGQASAEISQKQPASGTNRINIQIIRPATLNGSGGKRLVVGRGSTSKTWTTPELSIRKTGPASVGIGASLDYRIAVSNPGDLPTERVVVIDELPQGMTYVGSSPEAIVSGKKLQWQLGTLNAGQTQSLVVNLRADKAGGFTSCAEATASNGLKARDCVTTTIGKATLDIKLSGPREARVGERVNFEIVVTNRGDVPATGLTIFDTFDSGLKHSQSIREIKRSIQDLAPGQSFPLSVSFSVVQEGTHCQAVRVTGNGGMEASSRICVTATKTTSTPPSSSSVLSVRKTGPNGPLQVGQMAKFTIVVTNTGTQTLSNIKVLDHYDPSLSPKEGTRGVTIHWEGDDMYWVIPSLRPHVSHQMDILCESTRAAVRACNPVRATAQEGYSASDEVCLEIRDSGGTGSGGAGSGGTSTPPPATDAKLRMTVDDLRDPVQVGKEVTYEILVSNTSQTPDTQITLVISVPPEMSLVGDVGISAPVRQTQIDSHTIRFNPVMILRPGETPLSYRVRVRALRPGKVSFRASLTSQSIQQPLQVEQGTTITP